MTFPDVSMPIISTQWLADNLASKDLILLDVSMDKVVGKEPLVYQQPCFIPNSQQLSLEHQLINLDSDETNAFPTAKQFTQAVAKLGIDAGSLVVVYDNQGIYSSPRAWWIFKTMGFANVFILDGGLPQWIAEQRSTVAEPELATSESAVTANFHSARLASKAQVLEAIDSPTCKIFDARSEQRFNGVGKEPRAGLRSGHIPSAINLPFGQVLNSHQFKSKQELKAIYHNLAALDGQSLVFSCGSGITACILIAAAAIAELEPLALYDGSWAQWGSDSSLPIAQK